jgi:hypothetical protein
MSNNNTSLPAEFQKELDDLVEKHTLKLPNDNDYQIGFEKGMEAGLEIGAIEYATKPHTLQIDNERLTNELNVAIRANENLCSRQAGWQNDLYKVQKERDAAKVILTEVFQKHESGLLPDRFVYDKIKKFLYGE